MFFQVLIAVLLALWWLGLIIWHIPEHTKKRIMRRIDEIGFVVPREEPNHLTATLGHVAGKETPNA